MNERDFDDLLMASKAIGCVIHRLDRAASKGDTQAARDLGHLQAAQILIESEIDEDYAPLKEVRTERCSLRLLEVLAECDEKRATK